MYGIYEKYGSCEKFILEKSEVDSYYVLDGKILSFNLNELQIEEVNSLFKTGRFCEDKEENLLKYLEDNNINYDYWGLYFNTEEKGYISVSDYEELKGAYKYCFVNGAFKEFEAISDSEKCEMYSYYNGWNYTPLDLTYLNEEVEIMSLDDYKDIKVPNFNKDIFEVFKTSNIKGPATTEYYLVEFIEYQGAIPLIVETFKNLDYLEFYFKEVYFKE